MRIRLIQPPLVQPRYRQLTLPVVGAHLAAHGLEVEACDENVERLDTSDVDLVGITCHVYNAPRTFEIARGFRERGIPVLIGGTFPTVAPHLVAPHCDAVVVGELEPLAARIAADARAGRLAPVYRAQDSAGPAAGVAPDWSLLKSDRYLRFNFPLELSRGCRFGCRFCTAPALFPRPRGRSRAEIARDLAGYDHGLVEVVDVNFLNDRASAHAALEVLREAPIPGWTGQTTVADLAADPALPERLAESRCRAVFVGLESISREGLRSVDKAWSKPEVFLEVARRLREAGVLVQAGIIVGLDSDEPDGLVRTADFLEEARVQTASITWLHYYPGTAPFEAAAKEGRLATTDWRDYDGNRPVVRPLRTPIPELQAAVGAMLRRLYGARSIARRAAHEGIARAPGQLVHHAMVNAAMRTYYAELEREWAHPSEPGRRYMGGPGAGDRLAKLAADAGAWALDKLWLA